MPERTESFNWIIKGKIAASWWPDSKLFEKFKNEGISVVINCSEFDNRKDIPNWFIYHHFDVPDYGVPSMGQIQQFLTISNLYLQQNKSIVVHCVAGCGRTAQFIIAWAAYHDFIPQNADPVDWIRKYRPCSLETREQKNFARMLTQKFQQKG
jgi:protein-tyrosine phosphatase